MENSIVNENINNDFLSQSYSQGIERITGTKDSTFNFQIPKQLLEAREKTWGNLFDRYSKEEMSDDIELNVDTLEPEEEDDEEEEVEVEKENEEEEEEKEKETAVSKEEYSGQRVPMRKPATLVQYWINTGNPPYKVLSDENDTSETGSSLSESVCLDSNMVDAVGRKHGNDSSCSSVDTAAYILSNANVTKKADTIAIIEGAKCVEDKSLKGAFVKDTGGRSSNNHVESMETIRIDRTAHDDDDNVDVDVDVSDNDVHTQSTTEYMAPKMYNGATVNVIQSNIYSQDSPGEKANEADESSTNQRNLSMQTIDDIASIFRQFDKTSKRLVENDKTNDVSDRAKVVQVDTFPQSEKQASEERASEIHRANDTNLTAFHRKKLYTGRDSPVDLALTEKHDTNRLTEARQSLLTETKHPALDPDGAIKKTSTFLVRKGKNKLSLFAKKSIGSEEKVKKNEKKEKEPSSSKVILDVNDDKSQDSNIDSSCKSFSDLHDTSARQRDDHSSFQRCDDMNVSSVKSTNGKQNVASLNLEPIVLLERVKPSVQRLRKNKFDSSTDIARQEEKNIPIDKHLNKLKKLYSGEIENLEVETTKDSDESTIFICQCNTTASQRVSTLSDYSLNLRLDVEDDSFASNEERKLSSPENTGMSQKELQIAEGFNPHSLTRYCTMAATDSSPPKNNAIWQNVLSNKSKYSHLHGRNKKDNVKMREIKVVLERLPARLSAKTCITTTIKMQGLNKNNAISQKEISSNESEAQTHCISNVYGASKEANVKLEQLKVVMERLPANVCLGKTSNITSTNVSPNNRKTLQKTSLQTNHERKSQAGKSRRIQACENEAAVQPAVRNNYSLRKNTKSKENTTETDTTSDSVAESGSESIFNQSDSILQRKTFRRKHRRLVSPDNCHDTSKHSILTFTSDEDDFVRSIQPPRKRSKVSTDPNIVGKVMPSHADQTNLVNSHDKTEDCSRGSSTSIICSSKKMLRSAERDVGSIEKKKKRSGVVEMKSFDSTQSTTDSLRTRKNEKYVFSSSEADNDSAADHSDKHGVRISFLNSKRNKINNNRRKRLNGVGKMKENGIDRKNVHVMFFQTKTFDTNSSDSEESNSYTSPTCKVLRGRSPILRNNKLQYHHRVNPQEIFNESIAKRYSKRHLKSLDSSLEKHNRMRNVQMRSRSIGEEEAVAHERLANEESNRFDIKSRIDDTSKNASSTSSISNVRNIRKTRHVREKMSNSFLEENNLDRSLSENKDISDKSKNSLVILQGETYDTSTVRKLLTFQTKSYYDSSDSDETL